MADDDDFTFCHVGPPLDGAATQKAVDAVSQIHIDENGSSADKSRTQNSGIIWKVDYSSQKPETVGSLSFNVIDASSHGAVDQRPKQSIQEGDGSAAKASLELRATSKKPATRTKVPFEKGYSQMDWLKLTRTHPDLAGLKGQSNKRLISLNEVKQHQSEGSMWTVLKGRVYNIAPYMKFHPGGVDILMKAVGKDCTSLFNKYHAWVNAEFLLEKCLVGILDEGK